MDNEKRISKVVYTSRTAEEIIRSNIKHERDNPDMWREYNRSPKSVPKY